MTYKVGEKVRLVHLGNPKWYVSFLQLYEEKKELLGKVLIITDNSETALEAFQYSLMTLNKQQQVFCDHDELAPIRIRLK